MKFLISVIDDQTGSGTSAELAEINAFNQELRDSGQFVMAAGLEHPSESTVLDYRADSQSAKAGPLIDSAEYLSGFWIIEAQSLQQAKLIAAKASHSCNRRVELRPFLG